MPVAAVSRQCQDSQEVLSPKTAPPRPPCAGPSSAAVAHSEQPTPRRGSARILEDPSTDRRTVSRMLFSVGTWSVSRLHVGRQLPAASGTPGRVARSLPVVRS